MKETRTDTNVSAMYSPFLAGKSSLQRSILSIFIIVAEGLFWIARKTHLTYNAINVLVYYWLMPATWTFMIDWLIDWHVATTLYTGFLPLLTLLLCAVWGCILLAKARSFQTWCDKVFLASVDLLLYFNRWGGNYELNSVIICVAIPLIIYLALILLLIV